MTANLDSRIDVPDSVLFNDVGGEAVILNLRSGQYYGLDEVGTRTWSLLTQHGQVEAVYRALLSEYDVSEAQLRQDLFDLLDELASHGLLALGGGEQDAT